jgi:hypothetical protein
MDEEAFIVMGNEEVLVWWAVDEMHHQHLFAGIYIPTTPCSHTHSHVFEKILAMQVWRQCSRHKAI